MNKWFRVEASRNVYFPKALKTYHTFNVALIHKGVNYASLTTKQFWFLVFGLLRYVQFYFLRNSRHYLNVWGYKSTGSGVMCYGKYYELYWILRYGRFNALSHTSKSNIWMAVEVGHRNTRRRSASAFYIRNNITLKAYLDDAKNVFTVVIHWKKEKTFI